VHNINNNDRNVKQESRNILEKVVSFSRSMYNIDMEKETLKQGISAFVAKNGGYVRMVL
jgi:hypothetical protein